MEQLAYEEAAELYERALEVLELEDEPDERAGAAAAAGAGRRRGERGADLRRRARPSGGPPSRRGRSGDADGLVGAAIGIAMLSEAGKTDERLVGLIDEALEAIGAEPQRRARVAAERQVPGAVLAGRPGDVGAAGGGGDRDRAPGRCAHDARRRRCTARSSCPSARAPPASGWRSPTRWSSWASSCGDREAVLRGHAYRLQNPPGARRHRRASTASWRSTRAWPRSCACPVHIWQTHALRGMRAVLDGDLEAAERFAEQSRREGERAEQPLAQQYYGIQLIQIRSLQGRAGELLPARRELAERFPGIPAWRSALISLAARSGDVELGRRRAGALRGRRLLGGPARRQLAAGDRAAGRGDGAAGRSQAARELLYEELLPYAGLVIVVARAAGSNGPVDRMLGLLARDGRRPGPSRRAPGESRSRSRPAWATGRRLADSRVDLAEVLLARDGAGDRERALELLDRGDRAGARDGRPLASSSARSPCGWRPRAWPGWT